MTRAGMDVRNRSKIYHLKHRENKLLSRVEHKIFIELSLQKNMMIFLLLEDLKAVNMY